jgi:hypothetical protein
VTRTAPITLLYKVIEVTELSNPFEPIFGSRITNSGILLWTDNHLVPDPYRELAEALMEEDPDDGSDRIQCIKRERRFG